MESVFLGLGDTHNMIAGTQLAKHDAEPITSLSFGRSPVQIEWCEVRFPVQIMAKLCGAIEFRVPTGYEDETGFHYGLKEP